MCLMRNCRAFNEAVFEKHSELKVQTKTKTPKICQKFTKIDLDRLKFFSRNQSFPLPNEQILFSPVLACLSRSRCAKYLFENLSRCARRFVSFLSASSPKTYTSRSLSLSLSLCYSSTTAAFESFISTRNTRTRFKVIT